MVAHVRENAGLRLASTEILESRLIIHATISLNMDLSQVCITNVLHTRNEK